MQLEDRMKIEELIYVIISMYALTCKTILIDLFTNWYFLVFFSSLLILHFNYKIMLLVIF